MFRLPLYIDIDSTLIDTTQAMCDWYNHVYQWHKGFKPAIGKNIYEWDGKDQMPLLQKGDIEEIFNSDFFFKCVKPKANAYEVLKRLHDSDKFLISFCSIGTCLNISKKVLYLKDNFPFIKNHYMLVQDNGCNLKMDKSKIVNDGLLLDDHQDNLKGAKYPVLMRDEGIKSWNKDWYGRHVDSWLDFEDTAYYIWDLANISN